jgi:methyl-accepting chemotaxis protein
MSFSMGIARKLRFSLVALVVGLSLIGFAYWRVSAGNALADQRVGRFQAENARVQSLAEAFAEARRSQVEYAMSFSAESGQAFARARERLRTLTGTGKTPLQLAVQDYLQSGRALDERIAELGHDEDSGLQGQLRIAVHGVEQMLARYREPELQVSMLSMRRHEKDFILRREQKYADALGEEAMPFELLLGKARMPEADKNQIRERMQQYQGAFIAYAASRFGMDSEAQALDAAAAQVVPALQALRTRQATLLDQQRQAQAADRTRMNVIFGATLLAVAAVLISMLILLLRAIVRPLDEAVLFARAIADDRLDGRLAVRNPHDEIGRLAQALGQMQASLRQRIETERSAARENQRVRQALDAALANVMVVDADGVVVYTNTSLRTTFARAGIDDGELVGTPAERLDEELRRQFDAAAHSGVMQHAELALGDTRFVLQTSPVQADGRLLGAAIEWQDRRLELVIEHEVSALVARAAQGHLDQRIDLADKEGFVHRLAESVNLLLGSVQQHLDEATRVLGCFAEGDLRERMHGDCQGVYARMQQAVDAAMRQVGQIVTDIQRSATSVHASADEMASGTADLSARNERQAADVQRVTALVASVSEEAQQNLQRARESAAMSGEACAAAQRGREVAQAAIAGMHGARGSAQRVRDIVATVDGLAFQTNLLALNAAVEAARAGSHGRGFAVVANEVRNLAQRSANASQEIRRLIEHSLQEVEAGAKLVDGTGATMDEILCKVQRVAEMMGEISDASSRQGGAVAEVGHVLRRIGQSTEQNAALAEESSAAASSMREQAARLADAAEAFVVEDEATEFDRALETDLGRELERLAS